MIKDRKVILFTVIHPYLSIFATAVLMPLLMVVLVFTGTITIMAPLAWLLGWF